MSPHPEAPPVEVFPLAEYLCEEMTARGWTTADVARRMGGESAAKNQILVDLILAIHKDNLIIDNKTFVALGIAFDVSWQMFYKLDAIWRAWPDRRSGFVAPDHFFEPRLYRMVENKLI